MPNRHFTTVYHQRDFGWKHAPVFLASTATTVRAGHGRWDIENRAFNELSTQWHGDHAYQYTAHALRTCTLLLFIAYNLFHADPETQ